MFDAQCSATKAACVCVFPAQNVNPMLGGSSVAQGRSGPQSQAPPQPSLRNQVPPPILPSQVLHTAYTLFPLLAILRLSLLFYLAVYTLAMAIQRIIKTKLFLFRSLHPCWNTPEVTELWTLCLALSRWLCSTNSPSSTSCRSSTRSATCRWNFRRIK